MKNELTKTTFKSALDEACYLFGRAICLGALSLVCSSAPAQNLFVSSDAAGGNIYELTPNGLRSTFASGLDLPTGLAFDSAGNLFVANVSKFINGAIYKFTPAGGRTTFASGLTNPEAVAFDNAGNLFVSAFYSTSYPGGAIYKITSGGVRSTFAIGVSPFAPMACDSAGNLFVSDFGGNIYKFTPSRVRSTFAPGVSGSLAFQPTLTPTATLVNISTRGSVETG